MVSNACVNAHGLSAGGSPLAPRDELLRRFRAKDPAENGRFLIGVVTTGIYCLPTCRARAPKDENVRFFVGEPEARAAGLRPCKRCRPDHFYRGFDPDRDGLRELVQAVRRDPGRFEDAAALAAATGFGATKLTELFRHHYHTTPKTFLVRARVRHAMRGLAARRLSVLEAAEAAGFESASAFHENFREVVGLTPAAYREIGAPGFAIALPRGFRPDAVLGLFGRDPEGRTERVTATGFRKALWLAGRPTVLEIEFTGDQARVTLSGRLPRAAWFEAHEVALRCLGLESDAAGFERRASRSPEIARLVRGQRGLRIPRSPHVFEGLVWVVVGAQVNVGFAATCRAALIELAGTPVETGLVAHPDPAAVAALDHADLVRRQFSRRKAEYIVDAARAIVSGHLDLEGLAGEPATVARERLSAVRGLGPWSVEYLMLRSFGFEDCAPIGDVALAKALATFFERADRPDGEEATALMETFRPHRSLATYHLWRSFS